MANEQNPTDPEVPGLISELSGSRTKLEKFALDLESLHNQVSQVFPKKFDHRDRYLLDDKLKTVSSFYATMLSVRQEINRIIVHEIDIRRKVNKDNVIGRKHTVDIRQLAEDLDKRGIKLVSDEKEVELNDGEITLTLDTDEDE